MHVSEGDSNLFQAREGEFRVPHQEQPNLNPYSAQDNDEEVRYPTIGQRKPAAHKVGTQHCLSVVSDFEHLKNTLLMILVCVTCSSRVRMLNSLALASKSQQRARKLVHLLLSYQQKQRLCFLL